LSRIINKVYSKPTNMGVDFSVSYPHRHLDTPKEEDTTMPKKIVPLSDMYSVPTVSLDIYDTFLSDKKHRVTPRGSSDVWT
jgi:hypothetical protein